MADKKEKPIGITYTYVKEIGNSEIDFNLYDEILGKENGSLKKERIVIKGKGSWEGESHPIQIDRMIGLLNNLRLSGCNYVEVMYHCDHIGYYVNGLKIRKSTDKELSTVISDRVIKEGNKKKIEELQAQIRMLEEN